MQDGFWLVTHLRPPLPHLGQPGLEEQLPKQHRHSRAWHLGAPWLLSVAPCYFFFLRASPWGFSCTQHGGLWEAGLFRWQHRAPRMSVSVTLLLKTLAMSFPLPSTGRVTKGPRFKWRGLDVPYPYGSHPTLPKVQRCQQVAGIPSSLLLLTNFPFSLRTYSLSLGWIFFSQKHVKLKRWSLRSLSL